MLHKELIDKLEETRTNAKKVVDMCDELLTGDFEMKAEGPLEERLSALKDSAIAVGEIDDVYLDDLIDEEEEKEDEEAQ